MKRVLKWIWIPILIVVVAAAVKSCAPKLYNPVSYSTVYVKNNLIQLEAFARDALDKGEKTTFNGWDVYVYPEQGMVEFHTGGTASYSGFYYSAGDVPQAFQGADQELIPGETGWSWQADGDNHGYTERIAEHWYWFEASF